MCAIAFIIPFKAFGKILFSRAHHTRPAIKFRRVYTIIPNSNVFSKMNKFCECGTSK
jgi:hypothetical protein